MMQGGEAGQAEEAGSQGRARTERSGEIPTGVPLFLLLAAITHLQQENKHSTVSLDPKD